MQAVEPWQYQTGHMLHKAYGRGRDARNASVASLRWLFAFTGTPFGFPLGSPFTFTGIPTNTVELCNLARQSSYSE